MRDAGAALSENPRREVDREVGVVQVVVQISEDLTVAGADLRREGEQDQVGVVVSPNACLR